jgi:hypothetical protein
MKHRIQRCTHSRTHQWSPSQEAQQHEGSSGADQKMVRVSLTVAEQHVQTALLVEGEGVGDGSDEGGGDEWEESDEEEGASGDSPWGWEMTMHNKDLGSLQDHLQVGVFAPCFSLSPRFPQREVVAETSEGFHVQNRKVTVQNEIRKVTRVIDLCCAARVRRADAAGGHGHVPRHARRRR